MFRTAFGELDMGAVKTALLTALGQAGAQYRPQRIERSLTHRELAARDRYTPEMKRRLASGGKRECARRAARMAGKEARV